MAGLRVSIKFYLRYQVWLPWTGTLPNTATGYSQTLGVIAARQIRPRSND